MNHSINPGQTTGNSRIDQSWLVQLGVFLVIVLVGVASRFWLVELPNFKPVAAMVLFGAFYFRRSWAAVVALMLIMILSDLRLGVYDWKLAACVYGSLAIAGALGFWIKRTVSKSASVRLGVKQAGLFALASVAMSSAFYLMTNGAVWWMGQWYSEDWAGLVSCYAAGLPFYRATLLGDLTFTGVLVGGYGVVELLQSRMVLAKAPRHQPGTLLS